MPLRGSKRSLTGLLWPSEILVHLAPWSTNLHFSWLLKLATHILILCKRHAQEKLRCDVMQRIDSLGIVSAILRLSQGT